MHFAERLVLGREMRGKDACVVSWCGFGALGCGGCGDF